MLFTPKYKVSYRGVFRDPFVTFEIDPSDAKEMSIHGAVEAEAEAETDTDSKNNTEVTSENADSNETNANGETELEQDQKIDPEQPARRPGRPRKN